MDQTAAMLLRDPTVTGNAQQVDAHVKRHSGCNGTKRAVPVRKMTGIFPEKMADEGFRRLVAASVAEEEMLQLTRNAAHIKDSVIPM